MDRGSVRATHQPGATPPVLTPTRPWTGPCLASVPPETSLLPPTLILAAERDAVTPYDGALELHRRLTGSALVTERGAGSHGLAGGPSACAHRHLEAYLLEGRVPERRASARRIRNRRRGRSAPWR